MHSRHLFYTYYDALFSAKDYAGEVAAVFRHCASYPLQPLEHILEIGCGTGNHTLELAQKTGVHVTAVDIDAEMLALARIKVERALLTNVTFSADIPVAKNIDLCVALFNVVNYICDDEPLRTFFGKVAASLRLHGIFIFDCWNGVAALQDPPGSKYYEQQCGSGKIECNLTSETNEIQKITTLNYQLDLVDQSATRIKSESYQIRHRLWTPPQLKESLQEKGFEVLTVCIPFQYGQEATDTDWKIMFVCRKG